MIDGELAPFFEKAQQRAILTQPIERGTLRRVARALRYVCDSAIHDAPIKVYVLDTSDR